MALAEQPLIADSQHHCYSSTDQKQDIEGSLANSIPTEAPYSGTLLGDLSQREDTASDKFTIVGNDDPMGVIVKNTNCILLPYTIFLIIIGWRKIELPSCIMTRVWLRRTCELFQLLWPPILILMLLVSCITQILLCFERDIVLGPVHANSNGVYQIKCSKHFVSKFIILDILLLFAFCYGLYIFRFKQPEDLSTLAQKVFFTIEGRLSKNLGKSLLFTLVVGVIWIFCSLGINILRLFANNMAYKEVEFEFIGNVSLCKKIILLTTSIFGFIIFDVTYTAVVINYAMQCQLMVYFFKGVCTRSLTKPANWNIDDTIKAINDARISLKNINGHLSRAMGTMMFIFLYSSVLSLYGIQVLDDDHDQLPLLATTGFFSSIQWTFWFFIPLIQAARVSHFGSQIKETALEIRARPFQYQDTPQLQLDSFVTYCSNVELKAKLISVPISPSLVVGGAFILGFAFFLILQFDEYSWATWL